MRASYNTDMAATILPPVTTEDGLYRLSAEKYDEMVASGALGPDDPVELLDGLLFEKMPQEGPHTITILNLTRWLDRRCGDTHTVRGQMPILLRGNNRPEPDIAVVPGEPDDYPRQPSGEQVVLAVEVADKAPARVLRIKRATYAQSGVQEFWIIDVKRRRVEMLREPGEEGYQAVTILAETEPFAPLFLPGQTLRGSDILPRAKPGADV